MKILIALLLLVLTACAATPQKSQQVFFPVNPSEVQLPVPAAAFVQGETHVYPQPELGYAVRYHPADGADAHLDVFIYPLILPEGFSLADALEGHFNSALEDMLSLEPGAKVKNVGIFAQPPSPSKAGGLKAEVEFYAQGNQKSLLYLGVLDDVLIKVRFTEKSSGALAVRADEFVRDLFQQTRFTHSAAHQHPFTHTILAGPEMYAEGPGEFLGFAIGYLKSMQESIKQGFYLNTFEREYAAVSAGLNFVQLMGEKKAPAPASPQAQLPTIIEVQRAGFLREYVWEFMRRPYWQQPQPLKLAEFKLWRDGNLAGHKGLLKPPVLIGWQQGPQKPAPKKIKSKAKKAKAG